MSGFEQKREHISASFEKIQLLFRLHHPHRLHRMCIQSVHDLYMSFRKILELLPVLALVLLRGLEIPSGPVIFVPLPPDYSVAAEPPVLLK